MGQDSTVSILSYMLYERRIVVRSRREQEISLFSTKSTLGQTPTEARIRCVPEFISPGIKQEERQGDHSPPSSAEVHMSGTTAQFLHILSRHAHG